MQVAVSTAHDPAESPLDICLVVSGPNEGGGIERHIRDLAHGLAKNHIVHVLAHDSFRSMFDSSVRYHQVAFTSWRYDVWFLLQFALKIRKIRPNIIHAHGRKAARVVSMSRRFFDGPCVLTVHNLRQHDRLYGNFDSVIAVSDVVAEGIDHPRVFKVLNGC